MSISSCRMVDVFRSSNSKLRSISSLMDFSIIYKPKVIAEKCQKSWSIVCKTFLFRSSITFAPIVRPFHFRAYEFVSYLVYLVALLLSFRPTFFHFVAALLFVIVISH